MEKPYKFYALHMAILQITSNVCGEVNEVREERLRRRRERNRLKRERETSEERHVRFVNL